MWAVEQFTSAGTKVEQFTSASTKMVRLREGRAPRAFFHPAHASEKAGRQLPTSLLYEAFNLRLYF
jgi:hypothetical protein